MNTSAYNLLKESILSRPRMMGTPAEQETTDFLISYLNDTGLSPYKEAIKWSTAAVKGRKILYLLLGILIILINLFLRKNTPLGSFLTIAIIPIGFTGMIMFGKSLFKDKLPSLGKTFPGNNVICKITPLSQDNEQTTEIHLTAHSDSVATNMPGISIILMTIMILGLLITFGLAISSSIVSLVKFYRDSTDYSKAVMILNWIILGISFFVLLATIINLFSKRVNKSNGACDNGSGSVVLLKLAEEFQKNPLVNSTITFIWCVAEEWGLYGSKGYVKAHKEELLAKKDRFFEINVDMVGTELAYLGKSGFPKKKPTNKILNPLIEATAKELGIEARAFNSIIGGNSDHAPFKKEKLEVASFLSKKDTKKIHGPKDTIKIVKSENLDNAIQLISKVIRKLDEND
jgi:hypothetical protein